jgi:undecaprenyl diphosphate synthase
MPLPEHIAIIPDGNRRWAKAHRLNPWEGHREGVKRLWDVATAIHNAGVPHATFWVGSYDNLKKRSRIEVTFLIHLLRDEILSPKLLERLLANKVRARLIGEWHLFIKDKKTLQAIDELHNKTAHFTKKSLTILFGYDGQREMLSAVNKLVKSGTTATDSVLRKNLWTGFLPDVDLAIRTGGEPHWSAGFLMWQTANSQFYFTDKLWPDFKETEIKKAIADYDRRERRLGK